MLLKAVSQPRRTYLGITFENEFNVRGSDSRATWGRLISSLYLGIMLYFF